MTCIEKERERECVCVCVHVAGVPERIGALKSLVMFRFKPPQKGWQASALSIARSPRAGLGLIVLIKSIKYEVRRIAHKFWLTISFN